MIHRRKVLQGAATACAASVLTSKLGPAAEDVDPPTEIIDTNVNLFRWPFRRLPLDSCDLLLQKLRTLGITQAWAGSFEGLLHRDVASVNVRLAEACLPHPQLAAIGTVNLQLPSWEAELAQCLDRCGMPAIRLHPNYHGYTLADSRFGRLLEAVTKRKRFIQIAVSMEDTRTQHRSMQVPDVDLAPLRDGMQRVAGSRVQLLNGRLRGETLKQLAQTPGILFDTSRVEGTDGVATLLRTVSPDRVLFGTHAPFLIPEAAMIRVHESELDQGQISAVMWRNAKALL